MPSQPTLSQWLLNCALHKTVQSQHHPSFLSFVVSKVTAQIVLDETIFISPWTMEESHPLNCVSFPSQYFITQYCNHVALCIHLGVKPFAVPHWESHEAQGHSNVGCNRVSDCSVQCAIWTTTSCIVPLWCLWCVVTQWQTSTATEMLRNMSVSCIMLLTWHDMA